MLIFLMNNKLISLHFFMLVKLSFETQSPLIMYLDHINIKKAEWKQSRASGRETINEKGKKKNKSCRESSDVLEHKFEGDN